MGLILPWRDKTTGRALLTPPQSASCFCDSAPRARRGVADVGEETGWRWGELMLLRSSARWERTKEGKASPAAPILESAALSLRGNAVRDPGLRSTKASRAALWPPSTRKTAAAPNPISRERETWVGRGHKSSPASTGGQCSTGSSVAGVGRLVAAEIGRRGRARAFLKQTQLALVVAPLFVGLQTGMWA